MPIRGGGVHSALRSDRGADQAIGNIDRGADQGTGKNGRPAKHWACIDRGAGTSRGRYHGDAQGAICEALTLRRGVCPHPGEELRFCGSTLTAALRPQGAYHGDTQGAMDAVPPSVYNSFRQAPW